MHVQYMDFGKPVLIAESGLVLPLAGDKVRAGFPSPAEDFAVKRIDLTKELVTHPQISHDGHATCG